MVPIGAPRRRLPLFISIADTAIAVLHRHLPLQVRHLKRLATGSLTALTQFLLLLVKEHLLLKIVLLLDLVAAHLIEDVLICNCALELKV